MFFCSSVYLLLFKAASPTTQRHVAQRLFASNTGPSTIRLSDELKELFNIQVTREFAASQLYQSASIWCSSEDFGGMAAYMRKEAAEERGHALAFIDFASKRKIPIKLGKIEAPPYSEWDSIESVWEGALAGEEANTESLLALGDVAANSGDLAVTSFLQPYHMEQVDAEDTLRTILAKVRDENKTPGLLQQLDSELGQEVVVGQDAGN
jgi:ferritin